MRSPTRLAAARAWSAALFSARGEGRVGGRFAVARAGPEGGGHRWATLEGIRSCRRRIEQSLTGGDVERNQQRLVGVDRGEVLGVLLSLGQELLGGGRLSTGALLELRPQEVAPLAAEVVGPRARERPPGGGWARMRRSVRSPRPRYGSVGRGGDPPARIPGGAGRAGGMVRKQRGTHLLPLGLVRKASTALKQRL